MSSVLNHRDKLRAWFLAPDDRQADVFKRFAHSIIDHYVNLRQGSVADNEIIHKGQTYESTVQGMEERVTELLVKLDQSLPSFSPTFLGHLVGDQSVPGMLGMIAGLLYNQNNISGDYGPATVPMELAVGRQLCELIGYDPTLAWTHLSPTNVIANLEALWVARTLKYLPFAAEKIAREKALDIEVNTVDGGRVLLGDLSPWELVNLRVSDTLDMIEELCVAYQRKSGMSMSHARRDLGNSLRRYSITGKGLEAFFLDSEGRQWGVRPPVVIVPATYQFSYLRVADLLGLGRENLRTVPVDHNFRMDLGELARTLRGCRERSIPVLAVVSMCGTNLEGSVDNLKKMVELRESFEYDDPAMTFFLHSDASYGGYFRSILRQDGRLLDYQDVSHLMSRDVYEGLAWLGKADSVTIDPQVSGFVPYSAAAIAFQDGRLRDVISLRSPYTPDADDSQRNHFLAMHTIEAVRPGAPAVACWLSHQVIGLDREGYGLILTQAVEGAKALRRGLMALDFRAKLRQHGLEVIIPHVPDLSVLLFLVNRIGNTDLRYINAINHSIHEQLRFDPQRASDTHTLIIGRSEVQWQDYRPALKEVFREIGVSSRDIAHFRVERLTMLRTAVLNPWMAQMGDAQVKELLEDLVRAAAHVPHYEQWRLAAAGDQAD